METQPPSLPPPLPPQQPQRPQPRTPRRREAKWLIPLIVGITTFALFGLYFGFKAIYEEIRMESTVDKAIGWIDNYEYEKAEEFFLRYIEKNPRDADAHWNLATIYARHGKREEAIGAATRALQIRQDFPEAIDLIRSLSR